MAGKSLLPYAVIVRAVQGDSDALGQVLLHFKPYISAISMREYTDAFGVKHSYVDEFVRSDLQTFLLEKVLAFDLDRQ